MQSSKAARSVGAWVLQQAAHLQRHLKLLAVHQVPQLGHQAAPHLPARHAQQPAVVSTCVPGAAGSASAPPLCHRRHAEGPSPSQQA